VQHGNFFMFFTNPVRFRKYIPAILIGLPNWYVIGILVTFSDQFANAFGVRGEVDPGRTVMYAYVAITLGDVAIGFVNQALKSRKKALYVFYAITAIGMLLFFNRKDTFTARCMPFALCWASVRAFGPSS
jgi:hypothetical protein